MSDQVEILEMATSVGSLELSEELRKALTVDQGDHGSTDLTDLPSVVVGSILSRIPNPVDIASAFKASRVFWSVARTAPFRLRLRVGRYQDGNGDDAGLPRGSGYDAQKLSAWSRAALTGIRHVMLSTKELDLSGCPILDDDVAAVLGDLHCLDGLILDGCQKLTSSVAHALALSVTSGPRVLSLQRCFRLGHAAAGNLLAAAAADGSRLQVLLLSHLDKLEFPKAPSQGDNEKRSQEYVVAMNSVVSSSCGSGLRILALHNCGSFGYYELLAISKACPNLVALMLGGSMDGLGLSRPEVLSQEDVIAASSALVQASEQLSRLRILEITFFTAPILQAVREQVSRRIFVCDFCDQNSVATAALVVAQLKSPSRSYYAENSLFGPSAVLPMGLNELSANEQDIQSLRRERNMETINLGKHFHGKESITQLGFREGWGCFAEDVLMALQAGANCSDLRKRTPLHVAAARDEPTVIANLVSIGAAPRGMKDSGGATALFVAAESGHALVCNQLLRGGADILASNRAGETPLYIAALRGHSAAVEIMLVHCQERGVNWQDADVYGDGWTPLMAATVADRQEVGKTLLWGTGESVGGMTSTLSMVAPKFVDAQNRYGQTALHIAARRGSSWFVENLLQAGASLEIRDEYGLRAVDVARRHHHSIVEKSLKKWEVEHSLNDVIVASPRKKQLRLAKTSASASKLSSGGILMNQISTRHTWLQKSSAVGDNHTGSHANSPGSFLGLEVPTEPDSPTRIVPSWSPPVVSPHLEQVPVVGIEETFLHGVVDDIGVGHIQDSLESEASELHDEEECLMSIIFGETGV